MVQLLVCVNHQHILKLLGNHTSPEIVVDYSSVHLHLEKHMKSLAQLQRTSVTVAIDRDTEHCEMPWLEATTV